MNAMKKVLVLKIGSISIICLSLMASLPLFAGGEEYPRNYLAEMSDANILLLCEDESFRNNSGMDKTTCKSLITDYSMACNQLIEDLVPGLEDKRSADAIAKVFGNLAILHSMCIKSQVLDKEEKNH